MTNKPPFTGERVRLGELIKPARIERCGGNSYPILSMTMHDGIVRQSERFKKAIASKDTSNYKVVNPSQLVVGFPIDEGVIYVQKIGEPGIMSPAYNVWNIDKTKVAPEYLELALHSPNSMAYYAEKKRGTTARRRSITPDNLRALEIPLPSLREQQEVVSRFSAIAGFKKAASYQLALLDDLVKSRFVEMFGIPTDKSRWPREPLSSTCSVVTGNTPSRKHPEYYGPGIEWVKTDNIDGSGKITEASEHLSSIGEARARVAPSGSILMACIAGSVKSIGKVGILNRRAAFNQQINAVIPGDAYLPEYLMWAFRLSKDYLCSSINMQLKGILNKSSLAAKEYPLPPLALQREFADFVAEVDKSRFVVQQQIEKLQTLYDSLAQEYFG